MGFADGNVVSTMYDPMLAKLIVHDEDRDTANEKMMKALDQVLFAGIITNRDYLKEFFLHEKYIIW